MKRAGMDYIDHVQLERHADWATFRNRAIGRVILLSSKANVRLHDFTFAADDILLLGQESAGVPDYVRDACGARLRIPLDRHVRSLNVSVAAGIALAEALRQTGQLPI